jgi:hypothetical protein
MNFFGGEEAKPQGPDPVFAGKFVRAKDGVLIDFVVVWVWVWVVVQCYLSLYACNRI